MSEEVKEVLDIHSVKEVESTEPVVLTEKEQRIAKETALREQKMQKKREADYMVNFKKKLRESVELKELQIRELHAIVNYYNAKVAHQQVLPKIEEMEAQEQAAHQRLQEENKKAFDAAQNKEEKPKIVLPAGGKPRSETKTEK